MTKDTDIVTCMIYIELEKEEDEDEEWGGGRSNRIMVEVVERKTGGVDRMGIFLR